MEFVSKPVKIEVRQWECGWDWEANRIVAWVNANGGEAKYEPDPTICEGKDCIADHGGPVIAVRTINGWKYAAPGHYIVKGTTWFDKAGLAKNPTPDGVGCRDFYPVSDLSQVRVKLEWEPAK